ncbi:MAG: phytochelatin synthase family protein [Nodosilinea sp.]
MALNRSGAKAGLLFVTTLGLSLGELSLGAHRMVAQTLPLPEQLIPLTAPEGQVLLRDSEALADYIPLTSQFVTQINQAFCGVASMAMVLNALGVSAPLAPQWERNYFTQENIFNEQTEAIIGRDAIARQGLTLAELAGILETYPVSAEIYHGSDVSLEEFRSLIRANLETPGNYVLINYLRRAIGQERGGHISPLSAYDADTDQFLILDVSRYKYPPVWVQAETLWESINTVDSVSGKTRGFLLIEAR